MRHAVKGRKLKRTSSHKKATLISLATALFRYKKIKTTVAKAKETKIFAEKLITKARKGGIAARRYVARFIHDREVLKELFNEIVTKIGNRPGGYTRVVKLGSRRGDGAELAILELVDYNEGTVKPASKKSKTEKIEKVANEKITESVDSKETEKATEENKDSLKEPDKDSVKNQSDESNS